LENDGFLALLPITNPESKLIGNATERVVK